MTIESSKSATSPADIVPDSYRRFTFQLSLLGATIIAGYYAICLRQYGTVPSHLKDAFISSRLIAYNLTELATNLPQIRPLSNHRIQITI